MFEDNDLLETEGRRLKVMVAYQRCRSEYSSTVDITIRPEPTRLNNQTIISQSHYRQDHTAFTFALLIQPNENSCTATLDRSTRTIAPPTQSPAIPFHANPKRAHEPAPTQPTAASTILQPKKKTD
jgi:hypothetical protein